MRMEQRRHAVFGDWDGSTAAARVLQAELAQRVVLRDTLGQVRCVAGLDVGFEEHGRVTRAAVVLLDAATLQPVEQHVARVPTTLPYIPGLLSFRELPALSTALAMLTRTPDLLMVDGHGIAHPRRLGVAAHLGVVTGLPSIGVAKQPLCGQFQMPGDHPGQRTPLMDEGQPLGWVLRSKSHCGPLFVSPGHRISIDTALAWVQRCLRGYRLPEPTRLADRLASRRDEKRDEKRASAKVRGRAMAKKNR